MLLFCCVDGLANTGLGAAGSLDPYWKIISVPSGVTSFTAGSNAIIMSANGAWATSTSAKWIGVSSSGDTFISSGNYVYQLSFASASYYSMNKVVQVSFSADDSLTSVEVSDGSATIQTITSFSGLGGYDSLSSFNLAFFGPTTTTLTFTVNNANVGPSGLLVQFTQV